MPGDRQSPTERIKIAERRRMVFHLNAVRGLTAAEIAEVVGVSKRSVERDLRAALQRALEELRRRTEAAESVTDLALDIDAALAAVAREAWASVAASDAKSPQRVRALNTALAAVARRAEVLQSLGLLKKTPDELALSFDPLKLSDEEAEHELNRLSQQGASNASAGPGETQTPAGEDAPAAG